MDYYTNENKHKFRNLLERGDGGYRPGETFPSLHGDSEHAQIFGGIHGRTKQEHEEMQRYERLRFRRESRTFPINLKPINKKKEKIYEEEEKRRQAGVEVSIYDKFILPHNIDKDEFVNAYSAIAFANARGIALNMHITICWNMLGLYIPETSHESFDIDTLILHPLRDWFKKRDMQLFWFYSNECSSKTGFHTHLMLHVKPEHIDELEIYIKKRTKKINKKKVFVDEAVKCKRNRNMCLYKQWSVFQYICKGINRYQYIQDKLTGRNIFLEELIKTKYENPGNTHYNKRIAYSRNMNKKIRQGFEFKSLMEIGHLDVRELYPNQKANQTLRTEAEVVQLLREMRF